MRTFKAAALALLGALAWGAAAMPALGQRYVPLRYDLRAPPRRYMPGLPYNLYPYSYYGYGSYESAASADPYSFEAMRQRNYYVTGNVRAGKSFQGNTPYVDSGSQLTSDLPTMRLSNFRRDSLGVEDIGTGVEYGLPLPYFPSSAEVTTPASAAQRFAPGEMVAPAYVTPYGIQAARLSPEAYSLPGDEAVFWEPDAFLTGEGGMAGIPSDVPLPQGFWDRLGAYASDEALPPFPEEAWGAEGADTSAYGLMGATPDNLYDPLRAAEAQAQAREDLPGDSILYWLQSDQPASPEAGQSAEGEETSEVLPEYTRSGSVPWVATGGLVKEVTAGTTSPYAEWVRRAHEAMRQADYKEAERLYNDALALNPGRPVALFGRVHALVGLGYYNQAALVLERYLRKNPDWAKQPPDLSKAYTEEGVYDRAVESLRQSVKAQPESPTYNFLLGYVLYAGGQRAEARPYLEAAAATEEAREAAQVLLDALAAAPPP